MGYKQSNADDTLFYRHLKGKKTILLVYVDDIIIIGVAQLCNPRGGGELGF